jgi:hypothetical protein
MAVIIKAVIPKTMSIIMLGVRGLVEAELEKKGWL